MLQWMGGSRRKVTTSRKSTQKRQKQYFEQRKRQQQQMTAGHESYGDEINITGQHQKEQRSLDILSFLNLSKMAQECKSSCPIGREDLEVNASRVKYNITKGPPTIPNGTFTSVDPLEIKGARSPSGYKVETVSLKKASFSTSDNHDNTFNETDNKPDLLAAATEQQLSVFDLVGDDQPNGSLEGSPAREAHVAFSVEGLGKVGTETPVHSPQQPGRDFSYGCSSQWKAARQPNSSNNFTYKLDDLEPEVDEIFQNNNMPVGDGYLEFSTGMMDSYCNEKQKFSTVRDHTQYNSKIKGSSCDQETFNNIGHSNEYIWDGMMDSYSNEKQKFSTVRDHTQCSSKIKGSICDTKTFNNIGHSNEYIWDARSSFLDDNFLDERKDDVHRKNWPCQMDGDSADFMKYENDDVSDHNFEGYYQMKKRDYLDATERFNFLGSPVPRHQTSENYHDAITFSGARHPNSGRNFYFGDATDQPDWSCFVAEDARDSLSLLSEESCSSSAVRGEATSNSQSNLMARPSRRRSNGFHSPGNKYGVKNTSTKEIQYKNRDDIQRGQNAQGSGKFTREPFPGKSKLPNKISSPYLGNLGSSRGCLFKEGCTSVDISPGFTSFCQSSEKKLPSSGSELWSEDPFDAFPVPKWYIDAKSSFGRPNDDEFVECSHFGSFVSEKLEFCQPFSHINSYHDSPTFSKVGFEPGHPYSFPDSELEGMLPYSSHIADPLGETQVPDSSVQQSINKEHESKIQPAKCKQFELGKEICNGNDGLFPENRKAKDASNSKGCDIGCKEAKDWTLELKEILKATYSPEDVEETSSSVKIPENSKSSLDEKEYNHDAEIPLPRRKESEGIEDAGPEERTAATKRDGYSNDASHQVMMLESYVLQLLCVQKVSKEASTLDPLNKLKENLEIQLQKQILLTSGNSHSNAIRKEQKPQDVLELNLL